MKQRELVLRLRGVPEEGKQDLREYLTEVLAKWLQIEQEFLDGSIDR